MTCPLDAPVLNDLQERGLEPQLGLGAPGGPLTDAIVTALVATGINAALEAIGIAPIAAIFPGLDTAVQQVLQRNNGRDVSTRIRTQIESCAVRDLGPVGRGSRKAEDVENLWNRNGEFMARDLQLADQAVLMNFPDTRLARDAYDAWIRIMEDYVECIEDAINNGIQCSDPNMRPKRCRVPAMVKRCVRFEDES